MSGVLFAVLVAGAVPMAFAQGQPEQTAPAAGQAKAAPPPATDPGAAQPPENAAVAGESRPLREMVFKAVIDGIDFIRITPRGLEWVHADESWPTAVTLNGKPWDPRQKPKLEGDDLAVYVPDFLFGVFEQASRAGRGEILMRNEASKSVTLQFRDRPAGAAPYEALLRIHDLPWLAKGKPKVPERKASDTYPGDIRITATVDNNDQLLIYHDRAIWRHHSNAWVQDLKINNVAWSPKENARLENGGATTFMPQTTQFPGATLWTMRGRGRASLRVMPDHLLVEFYDPEPGPTTYDVVVHQGEVFPQLTITNDDKTLIADKFALALRRPHPNATDAPTQQDFAAQRRSFKRSRLPLAYEAHSRRDPKWDALARAFLENECLPEQQQPSHDEMAVAGYKLMELGCDDPVVCHVLAHRLTRMSRFSEAEWFALHAVLTFEKVKYPPRTSRLAPALLARIYAVQVPNRSDQAYGFLQRAMAETVEAARQSMSPQETRAFLADIRAGFVGTQLFTGQEAALTRMIADASDCDPWLVHMLLADHLCEQATPAGATDGWPAASGPTLPVSQVLLPQAEAHCVAAWALHPEHPEAAQKMIMLLRTIGNVAGETPRFWFDEAVAAQLDAPLAHETMLTALYPAWQGNHERMLNFGLECLRTGRFDTEVPETLLAAIMSICAQDGDAASLVAKANAAGEIQSGLTQIEAGCKAERRNAVKTMTLLTAWTLGWRDDAVRRLSELDGKLDDALCKKYKLSSDYIRMDLATPARTFAEAPEAAPLSTLFENRGPVSAMAVAPDGQQVALVTRDGDPRRGITIWNVGTGEPLVLKPGKSLALYYLRFSSDSKRLAAMQFQAADPTGPRTGTHAAQVTLWQSGEPAPHDVTIPGYPLIYAIAWLPNGRHLALATPNHALIVDAESGRVVAATKKLQEWIMTVAVSPRDNLLAIGDSRGLVQLYRIPDVLPAPGDGEPATLEHVGDLKKHVAPLAYLEFSSDARSLVSSSHDDRSVWIWDLAAREAKHRVQGWQFAISPDGMQLATVGGRTIKNEAVLWDMKTGNALRRCVCPEGQFLSAVAFTADGEFIIAPTIEGTLYTWQAGR